MPGKAVGRAAVELPWLCPKTDSLIALADAPASVLGLSAADPALSALFFSDSLSPRQNPTLSALPPGHSSPHFYPRRPPRFSPRPKPAFFPIARSHSAAFIRSRHAPRQLHPPWQMRLDSFLLKPPPRSRGSHRSDGTRSPLWTHSTRPIRSAIRDSRNDPRKFRRKCGVSITRRSCAVSRLGGGCPAWVATTIGHLNIPLGTAGNLIANRDLFAVVQLALLEAETEGVALGLTLGANRAELLDHLRLDETGDRSRMRDERGYTLTRNTRGSTQIRITFRSCGTFSGMAGESRRRNGPGLVVRFEDHIDALHRVVADLGEQVGERLRDAKLAGLAELAAGAGHEINNPLAIISGNAQRLLRTEPDADRSESLQAIVRQANRIAGLLRDLMQFARPPKPEPRVFPLNELVEAIVDDFASLAAEKGVRLELGELPPEVWLNGDQKQLRHALGAIARNAIEAAPREGWVRLSCSAVEGCAPVLSIEDSGPGLSSEVAEHAFDPFFCGRVAGRGRGLGLPTAWQLVRQNGGELRYEPNDRGPTRFAITLRRAVGYDHFSLRSA